MTVERSGAGRSRIIEPTVARAETERMVGRYRLLERIGGGGMGVVFRAEDPLLGREVAIKLARSTEPHAREMFLAEARHAARVVHPNLVSIFDLGEHEDAGFIAMELVHGTPLSEIIRRGPSDWMVAASIGVGVAAGLTALHQAMLVHRDVKPSNLMLDASGAVKVVDFGIATAEEGEGSEFGGSPGYIAPELILGERPRRAADVFALGVVLHELVTGRRLFDGESALARAIAVTQHVAPRLPASRAPAWFADLLAACLLQDPRERPSDASQVLAVLKAREPYAELATVARELRVLSGETMASEPSDDRTALASGKGPLVGRDAIMERLVGRRGGACWLLGRAGSGKTRLVSEVAMRCDSGSVLVVESAMGIGSLASALGLESARDAAQVRAVLRELAPVLVALEDLPINAGFAAELIALVHEEVPDALCVVTSEHPPPASGVAEIIDLPPLTSGEAEQFLASRVRTGRWALARTLAPLAGGHALSLELLALGAERSDQSLDGIRRGETLAALIERVLAMLSEPVRRIAELLSIATDRGATLLRVADGERLDDALDELEAYGLLERREHGPALHAAVRASVRDLLARDQREEAARGELRARLREAIVTLDVARARGSADAIRGLALLRPELAAAVDRGLAAPTLGELSVLVDMLYTCLDPTLPRFDAAHPLLDRLIETLPALGAMDETLARAYLARAWVHDEALVPSSHDAEEAIRLAAHAPRVRAEALATRGSIFKRRGLSAEAAAAFVEVGRIAAAEGLEALGALAHWEVVIGAVRRRDMSVARAALASETEIGALGSSALGPRIAILRALVAMELVDTPRALVECEAALSGGRAFGQTRFMATALAYLVEAHVGTGELALAESAARQAMVLGRTANALFPLGLALQSFAMVALMRGEWSRALRFALEGRQTLDRASTNPMLHARGLALEACCLAIVGEPGVFSRVEQALLLARDIPPFLAPAIVMYATFARGCAGEAEAFDELAQMLAPLRAPDHGHGSETIFAGRVLSAALEHVPRRRATLVGPHST